MYDVALEILNILCDNNYDAYIVGGYVRDKLLNIESNDIDIITNAKPEEINQIFNANMPINYGSINIEYKGFKYDITTFRKESNYLDNRRPSIVEYVNTLEEDLIRRDFTINSICINKDGNFIDIYNGIEDLNKKIIKTIGDPLKKIEEDALRILRAIRFSSIYDFTIASDLDFVISSKSHLVSNLSFDRIKNELNIIFNSYNCNIALNMIDRYNLFETLNIEPKNSIISTGNYLSVWAQLEYSDKYNFSKEEKKIISEIKEILKCNNINNYHLYKYDKESIKQASIILNINIDDMYDKLPIKDRKDINISYEDIINLGLKENISNIYVDLELQILYNKLINKKDDILSYINTKYKEGDKYE